MKRVPLVAKKALTYATRRLRAGDTFEASRQDARVLVAVGLANEQQRNPQATKVLTREVVEIAPTADGWRQYEPAGQPVRPPLPPIVETEIAALRYQYEVKTGRKPDMRWGVARLRAEIEVPT